MKPAGVPPDLLTQLHQQCVDVLLLDGGLTSTLANIVQLTRGGGTGQKLLQVHRK